MCIKQAFQLMSFIEDWRKSTTCKVQTVKVNCTASAMVQPSPIGTREIFSWNALKVSKLDQQAGNKKIHLKICPNDQATTAWFTSIRGVYFVSFSSSKLCQVSLTGSYLCSGLVGKLLMLNQVQQNLVVEDWNYIFTR